MPSLTLLSAVQQPLDGRVVIVDAFLLRAVAEELFGAKTQNIVHLHARERLLCCSCGPDATTNDKVRESHFLLGLLHNALLDALAGHKAIDHHLVVLAQTVRAAQRLSWVSEEKKMTGSTA
jgi:hypothetical protein